MTEGIDTSEEAIQTGRELLAMSGASLNERLRREAFLACPLQGRHYLTMDEIIELIPAGQGKTGPVVRARLSKNGITGIRDSFDMATVLDYLDRAPGKGWRRKEETR